MGNCIGRIKAADIDGQNTNGAYSSNGAYSYSQSANLKDNMNPGNLRNNPDRNPNLETARYLANTPMIKKDQNHLPQFENYPISLQTNKFCVALYDYDARIPEDLSFLRQEILEILNDQAGREWWLARSVVTQKIGLVPSNYLARVQSYSSEPWYFGELRRIEAEQFLMAKGNGTGSFLVRDSETQRDGYSLSVRDDEGIKHFRIRQMASPNGFYIVPGAVFTTLPKLIDYYCHMMDTLRIRLVQPCIKSSIVATPGSSLPMRDEWEISKKRVQLKRNIGQGQFGEVYDGLLDDTIPVAVKTLKSGCMDPSDFLAEAQIMKQLRHGKLIRLFAVCTEDEPFYIITELMINGNLLNYLQGKQGILSLSHQIDMASQIASGMSYLEVQNYIHRDLAARNILVGEANNVKIADFGLARVVKENNYKAKTGARFPIKWTAPEAAKHSRFTIKSDVWSFGILLMEIITFGRQPYPGLSNEEVLNLVMAGHRMPRPSECPYAIYQVMMDCWREDETQRPTFTSLYTTLEDFFTQAPTAWESPHVIER